MQNFLLISPLLIFLVSFCFPPPPHTFEELIPSQVYAFSIFEYSDCYNLIKIIEFSLWQVINAKTFSNVFFWWLFNWWVTLKNLSFDPFTSCEIDTGAWNGRLRFCLETDISTSKLYQERIKGLREWVPYIGPLPIVIPLKIFLDLLWGLLFPRGLRRGGRRRCACETAWMALKKHVCKEVEKKRRKIG